MCVVVVTIREDYCKLSCRLMQVNFLSLTSSVKRRQSCLFTSLRRQLKRSLVEFVFDKSSCIASSSDAIFSKIRVTLSSALTLEILWRVLPDPFFLQGRLIQQSSLLESLPHGRVLNFLMLHAIFPQTGRLLCLFRCSPRSSRK